jgi:HAD superfamily hydrolase (TIGR01509 family)
MSKLDISNYKFVFFDFDGTLVDTELLHYQSYKKALSSIGIEYMSFSDHVKSNIGHNSNEILAEELKKNGRTLVGLDELIVLKRYTFSQSIISDGVNATAGAIDLIYKLKQKNIKIAVVSGGKYEAINRVMIKAGIPQVFDAIITRELFEGNKPNPASYLKALEILNAKPKECIAFENDTFGIEAAQKAGIECVGIIKPEYSDFIKQKYPEINSYPDFTKITT